MKCFFLIPLVFITLLSCHEEKPLSLDEGSLLGELHSKNIGKLIFMGDFIPYDNFSEDDFVNELTITESGNFHFRMFLGKTLTSYLHQLEPQLTVRDLCAKGNFQLTFYVDDKVLYKYNLQTGAGSCEYKNSATVYGIPLSDTEESDHWGRFLWTKFMSKEGGNEALSNGTHLLKIEVRPYIETEQLKVGDVIAEGEVNLTIVETEVSDEMTSIQKIQPTEKWELSNVAYDTLLIKKLNKKIAQNYFKKITSIVVIKNGRLLIEQYYNGAHRETLHDTRSVGKTLASTIMGIAIADKHILDENRTLKDFYKLKNYKNFSDKKEKILLKNLLIMSSGFDGSDMNPDSPGNEENMYPTEDWVEFTLSLAMDEKKVMGEDWDYFTAGVVVLGDILNKTVPNGLEKYADDKLFLPLGITNYKWQFTPTNVPNTAGGFQMSSLDNARYIQMYLDEGQYKGQEILTKEWVNASLKKQISIPDTDNEYYGYLIWNKTFLINNKPIEAFYASGNGGNKLMIFRELGVTVVLTATAYGQPYMHQQADEIVREYILPSIVNR